MSEAELHQIRMRLHQGERQKAARGELRMPLPAGLVQERCGGIALNPDEEVQARLRFVFDKFRELQSAKAVMRELQRHGLPLPVRPIRGPAPHEVAWVPADSSRVLHILHNPAYAGTYAYGKRRQDPTRRRAGAARSATVKVAVEHWPVCLRDAHPGYIGWEEFMANQARLAGNVARHAAGRPGVPRRGCALLQGIAVCGRCGRRMGVRYSGPHGDYPVYHCSADQGITGQPRCQEVRALRADAEFERVLLEALAPDQIALAVAAVGQLEAETRALEHQWGLKRERARYEAERARRQYDAVEPENRLVARSLERVWEEKLRQAEAVEQAYEAWRGAQAGALADTECAEVLGLAQDLLRVWQAATAEERKRMLRLVVREVALDQKRERGLVWIRITWQTGATSEHRVRRSAQGYADYAGTAQLERRIRELNAAGMMDREIAERLNAEATAPLTARRSWARTSTCDASAGASRRSRSTAWTRIRRAGRMAAIRCRARRRRSAWRCRPCSSGCAGDGWPAASSPKASLGRSCCLTSKSPRWRPKCDGPAGQQRRRHDILGDAQHRGPVLERQVRGERWL